MNGLTRLCETLRDNHWGNLGLRWSTLRLPFPLSLSLSLSIFLARTHDAFHCFVLHPFISRDAVVSVSPCAGLACMAPVTFNRTNESRLNFSLSRRKISRVTGPKGARWPFRKENCDNCIFWRMTFGVLNLKYRNGTWHGGLLQT